MFENKTFKGATIFSVSALALAISGAANAFSFNVNETEVTIGGYAKLDMIYDVDSDLGDNAVGHGGIALDGDNVPEGHFNLHANQSRFGFQTATPLNGSVLKTNIEGDFYGSGGGGFRLRHAYGEWNGLLAGQTWVNFGDGLGTTSTIDFTGPGGQGNTARSTQLRYTTGGLSFALEDDIKGGLNTDLVATEDKTSLPSLTARYTGGVNGFDYSASALVQQVEHDNGVDDDSALGWGVVAEAAFAITPAFTVRGSVTHGEGIGNFMNVNPAGVTGYVDADGGVEAITMTGGNLGFSVAAGPGTINVSYSMVTADLDDAVDDGALTDAADETYSSIYANYIWSPVDRITYGVEVGQHSRETVGGDEGDALRVQGMVMYSF